MLINVVHIVHPYTDCIYKSYYIYYIYYIKTFIEKYKLLPYNDFNSDETYIF